MAIAVDRVALVVPTSALILRSAASGSHRKAVMSGVIRLARLARLHVSFVATEGLALTLNMLSVIDRSPHLLRGTPGGVVSASYCHLVPDHSVAGLPDIV
jgi:hypothetical protein